MIRRYLPAVLTAALPRVRPQELEPDVTEAPEPTEAADDLKPDVTDYQEVPATPTPFPRYADVTPLIVKYAKMYRADELRMRLVAWRESRSGMDPNTYRADRPHRGPFQFNRITWEEQAPLWNLPRSWDAALVPELNVELAAILMALGQWWRWPTSF